MNARTSVASAAVLAAALTLAAADAQAITCYVVFDRTDNVIYRDVYPPVDLSDAGAAERESMRRRGEYMLFMEVDTCPRLEFFTGVAGNVGVRLDEALAPSPETKPAEAKATDAKPAEPKAPRAPRKPAPKT